MDLKHDYATAVAAAKERLPVAEVLRRLGKEAPSRGSKCRSPFREERTPSFVISRCGQLWSDYSGGGEQSGGDAVVLIERLLGVPRGEAMRELMRLANVPVPGSEGFRPSVARAVVPMMPAVADARRRARPCLDGLGPGTAAEWAELSRARAAEKQRVTPWPVEVIERMSRGGLLLFGWGQWAESRADVRGDRQRTLRFAAGTGRPVWVATDPARINAQARPMDGVPWTKSGLKALTVSDSTASWPLGAAALETARAGPQVLLVEGGPDFVAGHWVAPQIGLDVVLAMLGATQRLPEGVVERLRTLRAEVVIVPHRDEAGTRALAAWTEQLQGVTVRRMVLRMRQGKDLDDFLGGDSTDGRKWWIE